MDTSSFYSNMSSFANFSDVTNPDKFLTLPDDWMIVVADISNSTDAIGRGEMKAVNILGVAVITAIRNAVRPIEVPYIFGGDGASLCIPGRFEEQARQTLMATRLLALQQFRLQLRIGIFAIAAIRQAGHDVLVAKHQLSEFDHQAAFSGGGIEYAERLLKNDVQSQIQNADNVSLQDADFEGLECRWDQVPSQHGETIALIVKTRCTADSESAEVFNDIISFIDTVYGEDEKCRPVHSRGLKPTYNEDKLNYEVRIRAAGLNQEQQASYLSQLRKKNLIGWVLMRLKLKTSGISWGNYKKELVQNTDFKKFDGVLRQVLSGNRKQRKLLEDHLLSLYKEGKCFYGIHVSDAALVTCMVDNRAGQHYHFVDSSGGGYTMAAEAMKRLQSIGDERTSAKAEV